MPDLLSTPMISTLGRYLSLTTSRERKITANMANIDTPGYHTQDIDFEAEMHKAAIVDAGPGFNNGGMEEAGFDNILLTGRPATHQVRGLLERPDGNNVDLDREGLMLSETQLQYQMGEQLVKHEFHQLLSAINGGN